MAIASSSRLLLRRLVTNMWPNWSLNRTRYGMSRKAGTRLGLHHRVPALRATPSLSG